MIVRRPSAERAHGNYGWLDARHTFSFARYYDARYSTHSLQRYGNHLVRAGGR